MTGVNNSTSPGFLTPVDDASLADEELAKACQETIAGISGLPGPMVRPSFAKVQLPVPNNDVDWCALQVLRSDRVGTPEQRQTGNGDGTTVLRRQMIRTMLLSFFGPNGEGFANRFSDGLFIAQNRDGLRSYGLNLIDVGAVITTTSLKDSTYRPRYDLQLRLSQVIERTYNIRNIVGAKGNIVSDDGKNAVKRPYEVKE